MFKLWVCTNGIANGEKRRADDEERQRSEAGEAGQVVRM